jgi:hypothetical protein
MARRQQLIELRGPAEFFKAVPRMPYLGHVCNLVAGELHHINIVGGRGLAGGRNRATLAGMGAGKNAVCGHVVTLVIDGERFHLVAPVRQDAEQAPSPSRYRHEVW